MWPVGKTSRTVRVAAVCALLALLAAGSVALANSDLNDAHVSTGPPVQTISNACSQAVLGALGDVGANVYREGVSSARTASALSLITHSVPLREAIERNDPQAVRVAARTLIATGHMTNLRVTSAGASAGPEGTGPKNGGRVLADAGNPGALAPLYGSILNVAGAPIASFVASVWADAGFLDETNGIGEGLTVLRSHGRSITGSLALPTGELPTEGELTVSGIDYRYTSFAAGAYPAGNPLRVYMFRSVPSIAPLCGRTPTDTIVNTVSRVARLIYTGEIGATARKQMRRVQHNQPLLRAVAQREPEATRLAIDKLLNEHIVRIRVTVDGQLLSDVGGPHVLAPVRAAAARRRQDDRQCRDLDPGRPRLPAAGPAAGRSEGGHVMDPTHPQIVMSSFPSRRRTSPPKARSVIRGTTTACSRSTPKRSRPGRCRSRC